MCANSESESDRKLTIVRAAVALIVIACIAGCRGEKSPDAEANKSSLTQESAKSKTNASSSDSDLTKGARVRRSGGSSEPKNWALLVGVTNYRHLSKLRFCGRDMSTLGQVLVSTGGYAKENVRIVADSVDGTTKPASDRATIREQWKRLLDEVGENDTVLFAFSGHGMQSNGKGYLMSSDADPEHLDETAVAMSWIYQQLDDCKAESKIVMVDACHSGTTKGRSFNHYNLVGGLGVYGLYSCEVDQQSWEDPNLQHGVFTYYLIAALRGEADLPLNNGNGDKHVTADEVFQFVSNRVPTHVKAHFNASQIPFRRVSGSGLQVLSRYKNAPVPEDTALITLPGLRGDWWFESTPWLLPVLRGKLSSRIKRKAGSAATSRTWTGADVTVVESELKSVFSELVPEGLDVTLPQALLVQLERWKGGELTDNERASIITAVTDTGDLHTLAVFQHFFGMTEAGATYKKAIAAFRNTDGESPGRRALCRADYGRWLAQAQLHREACAQFEVARATISDPRTAPMFHVDCWCIEADSHRKLGEWRAAERCLKTAAEIANQLESSHPIAAHIHRRFAWMYMDQWRLTEARQHFKEAIRVGLLPAKGVIADLDFRARIYIHHNNHGLAMCSRYAGDAADAIGRYRKLQKVVADELRDCDVPAERAALISRLVNTMERLADCYLFSAKPRSRTAADVYRQSYRQSGDLHAGQVALTRAKLICRRAIALAMNTETIPDSTAELQSLAALSLAPNKRKSLSLYQQIAAAIAKLRQDEKATGRTDLRDVLKKTLLGADRKKFSRDEFDLLFLASNELIRGESTAKDVDPRLLAGDVERLFDLIPSEFRRPEVLPYQRAYYDNAIAAWIQHVAPKQMVDLVDYAAIAKTGKLFGLLSGDDVIVFYFPLDNAATGHALVYSADGKHQVVKLVENAAAIQKAVAGKKAPIKPTLKFPMEIKRLLKPGTAELHWYDSVLNLNAEFFPYQHDGTLRFVGELKRR